MAIRLFTPITKGELMDLEHSYNYTRRPPSPTHRDRDEVIYVGHRMGYTKRKDKLAPPGKNVDYNAWCTCGWVDEYFVGLSNRFLRKWVPKKLLTARYSNQHIVEVKKQGVLRV